MSKKSVNVLLSSLYSNSRGLLSSQMSSIFLKLPFASIMSSRFLNVDQSCLTGTLLSVIWDSPFIGINLSSVFFSSLYTAMYFVLVWISLMSDDD